MKLRKLALSMIIAALAVSSAVTAFASEDFPPTNEGIAQQFAQPYMNRSAEGGVPIFSMEDYQEMNDAIGVPPERNEIGPVFGSRSGEETEINGSLREGEEIIITGESTRTGNEIIIDQEAANANAVQTSVPIWPIDPVAGTDTNTATENDPDNAVPEPYENQPEARDMPLNNPETGAADIILPLAVALGIIGMGSLMLKKHDGR